MVRLPGFCRPTVARLPIPISISPSPVITTTGRSGCARAMPRPIITAPPMTASAARRAGRRPRHRPKAPRPLPPSSTAPRASRERPARGRSVANARRRARRAPDGHRNAAGSQKSAPARRLRFRRVRRRGRAFSFPLGQRDCIPVRDHSGVSTLRNNENGISVSPKEYGSMNANARELAADFDIEKLTPEFYADPYPTYRALREHAPVKRMANGSYFLTRYDDLLAAYKNTRAFSSDKKKEFAPKYGASLLYDHHTTSLVFNDPPAHTRVRRLIMGALSPRAIAEMEPALRTLVDRLLARLADKTEVDLI